MASLCYIYKTRKHVGKRAICQTKLPMSKCQKAFEASILQLLLGLPVRRLSACSIEVLRVQEIKLIHKFNIFINIIERTLHFFIMFHWINVKPSKTKEILILNVKDFTQRCIILKLISFLQYQNRTTTFIIEQFDSII